MFFQNSPDNGRQSGRKGLIVGGEVGITKPRKFTLPIVRSVLQQIDRILVGSAKTETDRIGLNILGAGITEITCRHIVVVQVIGDIIQVIVAIAGVAVTIAVTIGTD